jgi:hypothetical protein
MVGVLMRWARWREDTYTLGIGGVMAVVGIGFAYVGYKIGEFLDNRRGFIHG